MLVYWNIGFFREFVSTEYTSYSTVTLSGRKPHWSLDIVSDFDSWYSNCVMRMGVFRGEKCLRRRLTCRGLRVKLRHVYMSSSESWMHMGLGKDVLVCSSQRSGIDAVHVSSMKSSMKFEF